jgi:1-acyl-sn-glycerol-3-phosphate acyltransferase
MLDKLITWDKSLFVTLNSCHVDFLDPVMLFASGAWSWILLYAGVVFFLFWKRSWKSGLMALLAIALTFALTDYLGAMIKHAVQRPRPCLEFEGLIYSLEACGGVYASFISNHAANMFGLATFSALFFRKRGYTWSIFAWAALVAYSRIYVGKHYPLDLLGGALFGLLLGGAVYLLYKRLHEEIVIKKSRNMYAVYYWIMLILAEPLMFFSGWIVLLFTFPFDPNRKIIHYHSCMWGLIHYWVSPWWKIHYSGKEHVRRDRPYIIVCNHQSMLDICLMYKIPRYFKWVSKKEAAWLPFVGQALLMHRDILISRGESASVKYMIRQAQRYLKDNICITIFPEGTRSKDGKMHDFKEGAFMLARLTKTAILPVVVDGTYDVLPKRSHAVKRRQHFYIKVLPEIPAEEVAQTSVKDLAVKLHDLMLAEHRRMTPSKYAQP